MHWNPAQAKIFPPLMAAPIRKYVKAQKRRESKLMANFVITL